MKFKIGDRVKVKESGISRFGEHTASRMRGGGRIIDVTSLKGFPLVRFAGETRYHIWHNDLELMIIKNQQLLFSFME